MLAQGGSALAILVALWILQPQVGNESPLKFQAPQAGAGLYDSQPPANVVEAASDLRAGPAPGALGAPPAQQLVAAEGTSHSGLRDQLYQALAAAPASGLAGRPLALLDAISAAGDPRNRNGI